MKAARITLPSSKPARAGIDSALLVGLRVLVVDDDRATREAIGDMLGQTGVDVRLAQSSAEALRAVEEFHPDVLLCDIAMPGEDGYAFIRRVRALGIKRSGDIPALALTALARDEDRDRALAAGYQMHIAKPVDIDDLTAAVLHLAASRSPSVLLPRPQLS
jgi:CheY-like chemotaxis protein